MCFRETFKRGKRRKHQLFEKLIMNKLSLKNKDTGISKNTGGIYTGTYTGT